MKFDRIGTFHVGIWPDPEPGDQSPKGDRSKDRGCLFALIPADLVSRIIRGHGGSSVETPEESGPAPLPKRIRELVELRRRKLSESG